MKDHSRFEMGPISLEGWPATAAILLIWALPAIVVAAFFLV